MIKQVFILYKIFFIVFGTFFFFQTTWGGTINIGSISNSPNKEVKKFLPFSSYLGKQLQSDGIDQGKVVVAESIHQMAALMREGKVDLYVDSPFPSIAVSLLSDSKYFLRRWKKGVSEYHTVIFVRKDSNIDRLDGLKGKVIGFEEPFSSSGYFLPKIFMELEELKLVSKKSSFDPVGPDEVGYVFCLEGNTTSWVFRKKVAAGAMENHCYLKGVGDSIENFKIIYKTSSIPRHIVSYRTDLDKKLVDRIKEILINMDKSEEGRKTLQEFEKTSKFDEIPQEALNFLLKSHKFIKNELGLK